MSSTAKRLFLGFSLVVLAFAGSFWSTLRTTAQINDALHGAAEREQNVRTALLLTSAVRDQYAHIAHSLLLGNTSHIPLYERARARVDALLADMEKREQQSSTRPNCAVACDTTEKLRSIRTRTARVDALFAEQVVPALKRGDRDAATAAHGEILGLVSQIQDDAEALASAHEDDIRAYEADAALAQRRAFWLNAGLLALALALAVGIGAWTVRSISRPVGALASAVRRLESGNLGAQVPEVHRGSVRELRDLTWGFNRMSSALKEQQDRLVAQEKLASVGRLAAGVAHEINNPVGVIQGYVELLKSRADPSLADDLRIIGDEAARCREIVQGLLDLARPPKLNRGPVRLAEVVEEVSERLAEDARVPHAQIRAEGDAVADADANRVRQIVDNLVRNAAQAAGERGHIQLSIQRGDRGEATLRVRDDGPGISPEIRPRLFEPFATGRPDGTGLGLAVSRALAEAQGGTLSGATLATGGAEFTLTLPGGGS